MPARLPRRGTRRAVPPADVSCAVRDSGLNGCAVRDSGLHGLGVKSTRRLHKGEVLLTKSHPLVSDDLWHRLVDTGTLHRAPELPQH
jgi:hypothetical protein